MTLTTPSISDASRRSPWAESWRTFRRQTPAMVALAVLVLIVLAAALAPTIAPYDPTAPDYLHLLEGPSAVHWAGTDAFGRDILSRIVYGARISLAVGLTSVTLGGLAGVLLGLVSGFHGGWVDWLIMQFCDILLAFPGIVLAIGIVALLGPGIDNVIVAVAIFSVPVFARIVRGNTLALKQMTYVEAARGIGVRPWKIMLRHILPGTLSSIIVSFSMRIGTSILTAASLSFVGLGAQPPSPEWGAMLADGRNYIEVAWHVAFFPGFAIFLTVLAFNLFGDGLRDAFDPKLGSN